MTPRLLSAAARGAQAAIRPAEAAKERWSSPLRDYVDLAFETDREGRFVILEPDRVLGWPARSLLGTFARSLLLPPPATHDIADLADPFQSHEKLRARRVWLRDAAGQPACMLISANPVEGSPGALRGLGQNITESEQHAARLSSVHLRAEATRALHLRMRQVAIPAASLRAGLEALAASVGAQGAALLLHEHEKPLQVAARAGLPWPTALPALYDAVLALCAQPAVWMLETSQPSLICGQSVLLCASANHFIDRAVLALWRGEKSWSPDEARLAESLLQTVQPILEHEQIQRETARLSRTDVLTGLYNRQGFIAELTRRFERLDRDSLPATLMVLGLDALATLNRIAGLEQGDAALCQAAGMLRDQVRPTDLVGRLGGDLFAVWMDGADQFAAAERADRLCRAGLLLDNPPEGSPRKVEMSIGLAPRPNPSFEGIDSLLHRAWRAMQQAKERGGARWLVSSEEPSP